MAEEGDEPTTRGESARRPRGCLGAGLGCAAVLTLLPPLVWALWVRPVDHAVETLGPRVEAAAQALEGRVARPVLRGEPVDGNAAAVQLAAAEDLAAPSDLFAEGEVERIAAGDVSPALRAATEDGRERLTAYRDATRRSWTWVPFDPSGARSPEYLPAVRAAKLLLAQGRLEGPDGCVDAAVDVIRLGQDLAPGGMLLGHMVQVALTEMGAAVLARCLPAASAVTRRRAAEELAILLEHAPGFGAAMRVEGIQMATMGLAMLRDTPLLPPDSMGREAWLRRHDTIELVRIYLDELPRWAEVDALPQPAAAERARDIFRDRRSHDNWFVDMFAPDVERFIARSVAAEARLRMLVVGARDLAQEPARTGPPDGLADPELADPFTGATLRYRREAGALILWSVGPDGADDAGVEDPDASVPGPDVTLALRP